MCNPISKKESSLERNPRNIKKKKNLRDPVIEASDPVSCLDPLGVEWWCAGGVAATCAGGVGGKLLINFLIIFLWRKNKRQRNKTDTEKEAYHLYNNVVPGWWFAASPFELFLNGIHMTYAICMPFKNSMILFINILITTQCKKKKKNNYLVMTSLFT